MKILLFDIENAPAIAYIWQSKTEYVNPEMIKDEWYMMCWAAKWLGEKKIMSSALCDHKGYDPRNPNDKQLLGELWKLLDEADIVVAHNGKSFDCKKANACFIKHGITPPSPYIVIDTLTEARKHFMFTSNKLNELGKVLGVGAKIHTGGFKLWLDCMLGDTKAWNKMKKYCRNDVLLLEKVYLKLRPYMKNHPCTAFDGKCPRCGSTAMLNNGTRVTLTGRFQRLVCKMCGGHAKNRIAGYTKEERLEILKTA